MIPAGASVLDLGIGQQELKNNFTGEYNPCDNHGDVLFCDFNLGVYPDVKKVYDVAVIAGVLEYLESPAELIAKASKMAKTLIVTYAVKGDGAMSERLNSGWINHMTKEQVESLFTGLTIELCVTWNDQLVWKCAST